MHPPCNTCHRRLHSVTPFDCDHSLCWICAKTATHCTQCYKYPECMVCYRHRCPITPFPCSHEICWLCAKRIPDRCPMCRAEKPPKKPACPLCNRQFGTLGGALSHYVSACGRSIRPLSTQQVHRCLEPDCRALFVRGNAVASHLLNAHRCSRTPLQEYINMIYNTPAPPVITLNWNLYEATLRNGTIVLTQT